MSWVLTIKPFLYTQKAVANVGALEAESVANYHPKLGKKAAQETIKHFQRGGLSSHANIGIHEI